MDQLAEAASATAAASHVTHFASTLPLRNKCHAPAKILVLVHAMHLAASLVPTSVCHGFCASRCDSGRSELAFFAAETHVIRAAATRTAIQASAAALNAPASMPAQTARELTRASFYKAWSCQWN